MRRRFHHLILFALLIASAFSLPIRTQAASESSRTKHRIGVFAGFNPDIAPATIAGGLGVNVTDYFRIYGAYGAMNKTTQELPVRLYNNSFGLAFTTIFAAVAYVATLGLIKYRSLWDALDMRADLPEPVRVSTYGGGFKLMIPGLDASPAIGLGYAKYTSDGSYGLGTTGEHLFFTGGLDATTDGGFHFNLGGVYSPQLPKNLRWRLAFSLGFYF